MGVGGSNYENLPTPAEEMMEERENFEFDDIFQEDAITIIIGRYEKIAQTIQCFLHLASDWRNGRDELCKELFAVADRINSHHLRCNISTITGSSVSVIGGGTTIAGLLFFPPIAIVGIVAIGIAGVSNIATKLTEYGITRHQQKRLEVLLKVDEEKSLKLFECLDELRALWVEIENQNSTNDLTSNDKCLKEGNVSKIVDKRFGLVCAALPAKGALLLTTREVVINLLERVTPALASGVASAATGIGLVVDGYTIFAASKDIHNGSQTDYAARLRLLAEHFCDQVLCIDRVEQSLRAVQTRSLPQLAFL